MFSHCIHFTLSRCSLTTAMEGEKRPRFKAVNNVTTTALGQNVDTRAACIATHGKLAMDVFPAHVSKSKTPSCTNCLFQTGQLVNTGAKSPDESLLGVTLFVERLNRQLGLNLRVLNHEAQNIVLATNLGFKLNLALVKEDGHQRYDRKWDPKLFPGLKLESPHRDIVFIFFASGNVIATGMKSIDRRTVAEEELFNMNMRRYETGKEYRPLRSYVDRPLSDPERSPSPVIKSKKSGQFKVITQTSKRSNFQANLRNIGLGRSGGGGSSDANASEKQKEADTDRWQAAVPAQTAPKRGRKGKRKNTTKSVSRSKTTYSAWVDFHDSDLDEGGDEEDDQ